LPQRFVGVTWQALTVDIYAFHTGPPVGQIGSWNKLQHVSGDNGKPEPKASPLGTRRFEGCFLDLDAFSPPQMLRLLKVCLSAASSSKPGRRNEWDDGSPSGSVHKRKSHLRMVDEFGNALPDQPAMENKLTSPAVWWSRNE